MKRTATLLATLFVGSALAAAPALAADGGVAKGANKDASSPGGTMTNSGASGSSSGNAVERGANKSDNADGGAGNMMSSGKMATSLKTAEINSVTVVNASEMSTKDSTNGNSMSTDTTPEEQAQIQSALEANPSAKSKLEAKSVDLSSIVSANLGANGELTVYVR